MLIAGVVFFLAVVLMPMCMRGRLLHNHMAQRCADVAERVGCRAELESPLHLPDGRVDYVDVLISRDRYRVACEIETSARYVAVNAAKASTLGLPLLIVVPNRRVRDAVKRRVGGALRSAQGPPVSVLLLGQFEQALTRCFAFISTANRGGRKQKRNRETGS